MKKRSESGDTGGAARKATPVAKVPRVVPSRIWWEGARALWNGLAFRERALILLGIIVPALDQLSRLAALGVMMKAVSKGIREPLDIDMRLWLGLAILSASIISYFIQLFSSRIKVRLKTQYTKTLRRIHGGMMAEAAGRPVAVRNAEVGALAVEEKNFMASATSGVSDLHEFSASIFILVVLSVCLTWFSWIVGVIIVVVGLLALITLKLKVKSPPRNDNDDLGEARENLTERLNLIARSRNNRGALIEDYANNRFDKLTFKNAEAKSTVQKKIGSAMNFGSAILMAAVFFLVSEKGAFDERKVVWIVVFIFALRMAVSFGKTAMVKWGGVLAEKNTLMVLAKASLRAAARTGKEGPVPEEEEEWEEEKEEEKEEEEDGATVRTKVKIVDYSFSGLNGAEIASREPMVVEMTVEAEEEVQGFYWSFAITLEQGSPYLMSKASEDYGITWNLPKGRSTFRLVTGPVWLPAGNYFAMVGTAAGNRLLDLVGAGDSPVSLCVLPDEATKRSFQTREACDVVLVDVNWDLEFQQVQSETNGSRDGSDLNLKKTE